MLIFLRHCRKVHFYILIACLLLIQPLTAQGQVNDQAKKQQMLKMYQTYKSQSFPNIPDIFVEKYQELKRHEKIILLDVREPSEQKISMIPGAITKEEFEKNIDRYKSDRVVLYCTIGYRNGLYTQKLLKKDCKVMNPEGGVLAWPYTGQLFAGPDGETNRVHVYVKKWNLLPLV